MIVPGRYTVQLNVDGHIQEHAVTITMDPRVSTSAAGLREQYAVTSRLAIHASILNALNSQPPIDLTTYGAADDLAYNPAMHQAGAIGRFYNLGASYTF